MTGAERIEHELSTTLEGLTLVKQASEHPQPARHLAFLVGRHTHHDLRMLDQVDFQRAYDAGLHMLIQGAKLFAPRVSE